jgi:hypothetical protein
MFKEIAIDNSPLTIGVTPPRFERGTYSLEGCCSIQLSYGAVLQVAELQAGTCESAKEPHGGRKYSVFEFLMQRAPL